MSDKEKINYLLDNDVSSDGVDKFVSDLWDDNKSLSENLYNYNNWWATVVNLYL